MKLSFTLTIFLTLLQTLSFAQLENGLFVNEFSNGTSGAKEFVELMVVTANCEPALDIRHWIVDDNNGDFSGGPSSGEGIAAGHMRFKSVSQWQNVPRGAIIVIYDDTDPNLLLPADDPTDANNDSIYILPANSNLLEWCDGKPNPGDGTYAACAYTSGGSNWSYISLRNGGDAMQTRKPDFSYFHGVGYGSGLNGGPDNIYFSGSGSGMAYQFGGVQEQDYRNQANWSSLSASMNNPGQVNNADNQTFRKSLSQGSSGSLTLDLGSDTTICAGDSVLVQINPGFQYIHWSHDGNAHTFIYLKPSDSTSYIVTALENSCTDTLRDTLNILVSATGNPSFTAQDSSCADDGSINLSTWLSAQASTNGTWLGPGVSGNTFNPAGLAGWIHIRYTVGSSPCDSTHLDSIHVSPSLNPSFTAPDSLCEADGPINLNNWLDASSQTGGIWQGIGVSGNTFDPAGLSGNQIITYTLKNDRCDSSFTQSFVVLEDKDPNWTAPAAVCENSITNLNSFLPGGASQGGSFSGDGVNGANLNTTGLQDSVLVTYTIGDGSCLKSEAHYILINAIGIDSVQSSASSCNKDGSLSIFASGENGPFQYSIDNGNSWQANSVFNGLGPGNYNVLIMDQVLCTAQQNAQVFSLAGPQITQVFSSKETCNQGNATARIQVQGNSNDYRYSLDGLNFTSDSNFYSLSSGNYQAFAIDSLGCKDSFNFSISAIPLVEIDSIQVQHATCNEANGGIIVFASNGPGPYSYFLNGSVASSNINNLDTGTYTLRVVDSTGCTDSVLVQIKQLGKSAFSNIQTTAEKCDRSDGEIALELQGKAPYQYRLNGGAWQLDSVFSGLSAGQYYIEVLDRLNCLLDTTVNLPEHQAPLILDLQIQQASCGLNNGAIGASVFSNTSVQFALNGGAFQSSGNFINLSSGNYTLTVLDSFSCLTDTSFSILDLSETSFSSNSYQVSCAGGNDGAIAIHLDSIHAPYSISWSPAPQAGQGTDSAYGFSAGKVYVQIVDSLGCSYRDSFNLTEPSPMVLVDSVKHIACYGDSSASISLQATGGSPSYQIYWTDGNDQWQRNNLSAGNYAAWVIDAQQCSTFYSVEITQASALIANAGNDITVCYQESFSIQASASGGTAPYSYEWLGTGLTGSGSHDLQLNTDSCFVLKVTDAAGCVSIDSVMVNVRAPLQSQISISAANPCVGDLVNISASGSGGNGNYQFLWNGNTSGNSISFEATSPGYVYLQLSDICSPDLLDSIFVDVQPLPSMNLNLPPALVCDSFFLNLQPSLFNTDSCSFTLSNGVSSKTCGNFNTWLSQSGIYDLEVILYNAQGCSDTFHYPQLIQIERSPIANFSIKPSSYLLENPEIQLENQSSLYAYNVWYIYKAGALIDSIVGDFSHYILPLENGVYDIVQKSVSLHGCQVYKSKQVELQMPLKLFIANCFSPNGDSKNDVIGIQGPVQHFAHAQLQIFDRWGKQLFVTQHAQQKWDGYLNGKKVPQGVYAYRLVYQLTEASEIQVKKGALTILH